MGNKVPRRKKEGSCTERVDTQDNDMDLGKDEGMEELSFIPSVVIDSAGWHELIANTCAIKSAKKEGFKLHGIAAILVEDDGKPHTISL